WLDAARVADIRRSRRAIRDILVGILAEGVKQGVFDPPQIEGRRDLKAIAMALLDQCTHVSMWYGPGGELSEEQMARLYPHMPLPLRDMARGAVETKPVYEVQGSAECGHET